MHPLARRIGRFVLRQWSAPLFACWQDLFVFAPEPLGSLAAQCSAVCLLLGYPPPCAGAQGGGLGATGFGQVSRDTSPL